MSIYFDMNIYNKKCDYFITCDDKFIKTINKHSDSLSNVLGK